MKEFSFSRVVKVMKYAFGENRLFYIGMSLSGVASALVMATLMNSMYMLAGNYSNFDDYIKIFSIMCMVVMSCAMIACVFHVLRSRRRRISFLMLPAGMFEKFLALVLLNMCVVGVIFLLGLILFLCYALPDSTTVFFTEAKSTLSSMWFYMFFVLIFMFVPSAIMLLNANLLRNNLIPTGFLVFLLCAIFAAMFDYADDYSYVIGYDNPSISYDEYLRPFYIKMTVVGLVLTVVCWVLSWLSFKRMQIRSFLNR